MRGRLAHLTRLLTKKHPPVITKKELALYFDLHKRIAERIVFIQKGLAGTADVGKPEPEVIKRCRTKFDSPFAAEATIPGIEMGEYEWDSYEEDTILWSIEAPEDYITSASWVSKEIARREKEAKDYEKIMRREQRKKAEERKKSEMNKYLSAKRELDKLERKLREEGRIK